MKIIITENQFKDLTIILEDKYEAQFEFGDIVNDERDTIINDIIKGVEHEEWVKIDFSVLKKIWEYYVKTNRVIDTRGLSDIIWVCLHNIAKLFVNTELVGHTSHNLENIVNDELESRGLCFKKSSDPNTPIQEPIDPKQYKIKYRDSRGQFWRSKISREERDCDEIPYTKEEFFDRLDKYIGDDKFSDYATGPLIDLAYELIASDDPVERLLICDRIFNVVHMRGDIAELFIDGGSHTLSQLSGEHQSEVHRPMFESKSRRKLIIITESQGEILLHNDKPSDEFDEKHGTKLSQQYKFPFGLSDDMIWTIFSKCRLYKWIKQGDSFLEYNRFSKTPQEYCKDWEKIVNGLTSEHFPYSGVESFDFDMKEDILCGMASNFNVDDIEHFSIKGIHAYDNQEVKNEINRAFPAHIRRDIEWVVSPATLEKMKDQLFDKKLSMVDIAKNL